MKWLTLDMVLAIHARSLVDHGGAAGIRDQGLLESALSKPLNLAAYSTASLGEFAAAYFDGLIKNHPFLDGNKRTAFLSAYVFLGLNGKELQADEDEAAAIVYDYAAGRVSRAEIANWFDLKLKKV